MEPFEYKCEYCKDNIDIDKDEIHFNCSETYHMQCWRRVLWISEQEDKNENI